MKQFKKLFAFLLAFTMMLGMATAVFAEGDLVTDGTISVTDLDDSDKVSYYKVVEWVDGEGWALTEAFAASGLTMDEIYDGLTQAEADLLADCVGKAGSTATPVDSGMAVSGGKWEVADPEPGLYMVLVAAGKTGVVYNAAFVAADYKEDNNTNTISINASYFGPEAIAKKSTVEVFKTTEDQDKAIATAIDSHVGEEVTFYVETTIPVFLDSFKNPSFDLEDKASAGIEMKLENAELTYGSTTITTDDTGVVENDDVKFEVTATGVKANFKPEYLKANAAPVSVNIKYFGKITNQAEFTVNPDKNDVTVTYSNGHDTEKGAVKDVTNHYTFSITSKILGSESETDRWSVVRKVGLDENGDIEVEVVDAGQTKTEKASALPGATFKLYKTEAGATAEDDNDLYTNDLFDGTVVSSSPDGYIEILGLAAGTYYLKEIAAPAGYIKDSQVHSITITPTYNEVTVTETDPGTGIEVTYSVDVLKSYTVAFDGVVKDEYTFENDGPDIVNPEVITEEEADIVNTPGNELPSTGGIGTTIFYTLGTILVLGAGIVLVSRRRAAE